MMKRIAILFLLIFLNATVIIAQEDVVLTIVTHDSFAVSEDVLLQFESENNIKVEILRLGDAGQMVNQSILSKSNPLGDVIFGVDNTFLSRALDAELFVPYEPEQIELIREGIDLDTDHRVVPIDYGDICLNYDIAYFESNSLALPESLADLTKPEYKGLLVVQNPATSSPGLAFLLMTVDQFGTESDYTYLDYWTDLMANDALITDGWSDAYFGYFTAGSEDGTYPMVVSYASSPPFTVDEETGIAATSSIVADGMCFRQIEFAGILDGTDNLEEAQLFIDFMLDVRFQEDIPFQMYMFPANMEAELPELFAEYAALPENPVMMEFDAIEGREAWIEAWTETVLR